MSRETKAHRQEREAAEAALYNSMQRAVEISTYPKRLMKTLERATKHNFDLEVRDQRFCLYDRDERYGHVFKLPLEYDEKSNSELEDLIFEVDLKEERAKEAAKRAEAKQAALAKLTKEERELLGL
jgi:hypothetical protein